MELDLNPKPFGIFCVLELGARCAALCIWLWLVSATSTLAQTVTCAAPSNVLGVARTIEIDASTGPIFGSITHRAKEANFLRAKEVVLTFDDGPVPWTTGRILDALERECTKATFFSVGKMALAYPTSAKKILERGHTLGGHTHTHTSKLLSMPPALAVDEIERGMGAVAAAAGQPIAPFFRFPGLRDSNGILGYFQARGIATFTVDVVSNDSFIGNPAELATRTLAQVRSRGGGIILFHDIKSVTVKALPRILKGLRESGFRVVHLVSKRPLTIVDRYNDGRAFQKALARSRERKTQNSNGDATRNSSWVAEGVPGDDRGLIDEAGLAPSSFENAMEALSLAETNSGPSVTKLYSPARAREGAWRYLPPPAPDASPRRDRLVQGLGRSTDPLGDLRP